MLMLDRIPVTERLCEVFREMFDDDQIQIDDATTAADIDGWDSLAHITLVLTVEREFKIRLTTAEVGALKNVGQMIDLIVARAPPSPSGRA
jgi:acyl carrier protein